MKNINANRPILIATLVFAVDVAFAQPGGGGPGGGAPPLPISGLEWLLLAGGIFGAKKIYENYRNKRNE